MSNQTDRDDRVWVEKLLEDYFRNSLIAGGGKLEPKELEKTVQAILERLLMGRVEELAQILSEPKINHNNTEEFKAGVAAVCNFVQNRLNQLKANNEAKE